MCPWMSSQRQMCKNECKYNYFRAVSHRVSRTHTQPSVLRNLVWDSPQHTHTHTLSLCVFILTKMDLNLKCLKVFPSSRLWAAACFCFRKWDAFCHFYTQTGRCIFTQRIFVCVSHTLSASIICVCECVLNTEQQRFMSQVWHVSAVGVSSPLAQCFPHEVRHLWAASLCDDTRLIPIISVILKHAHDFMDSYPRNNGVMSVYIHKFIRKNRSNSSIFPIFPTYSKLSASALYLPKIKMQCIAVKELLFPCE